MAHLCSVKSGDDINMNCFGLSDIGGHHTLLSIGAGHRVV